MRERGMPAQVWHVRLSRSLALSASCGYRVSRSGVSRDGKRGVRDEDEREKREVREAHDKCESRGKGCGLLLLLFHRSLSGLQRRA